MQLEYLFSSTILSILRIYMITHSHSDPPNNVTQVWPCWRKFKFGQQFLFYLPNFLKLIYLWNLKLYDYTK